MREDSTSEEEYVDVLQIQQLLLDPHQPPPDSAPFAAPTPRSVALSYNVHPPPDDWLSLWLNPANNSGMSTCLLSPGF